MSKKRIAALLSAAVLACSLSITGFGATQETEAGSDIKTASSGETVEFVVGIPQDLDDSLDPYQITAAGTREVMFNVFEGLVKPDPDGNFVDAVASSHEISEDGLTYTFTVRDGVIFHNGAQCTADDVLYSFETCAASTTSTAVAGALSDIADISADGNVVAITLNAANSSFLSTVSSVSIVPKDYDSQATAPVGTGPFRFVSRSVQDKVVFERNNDYYGEKPALSKVTCKIYEDNNALFTAVDSGALDMAFHLTVDQVNNLTNGYNVIEGEMNLVQALYLNNAAAPFDDVKVRQALCYAIDVDAILALTEDGHGAKLGSSVYPSFAKYFDESLVDAYPYDPAKASELLNEAGASGLSFTIRVPGNYTPHVNTAIVIAEMLAAVGVNASIEQVDWQTWLSDVYQGRNFEATVIGFDAAYLSPDALLQRWVSTDGSNMIGYSNPDYDEALAKAQSTTDDSEQTEAYKAAAKILSDTAANVYIQDLADFVALNPEFTGYEFYPLYAVDFSKISPA